MKYKYNILGLVLMLLLVVACEPDKYELDDIALTPIYKVSGIDNDDFRVVNIYKEKDLFSKWDKNGAVLVLNTKDYTDSSTDEEYQVSLTAFQMYMDTRPDTVILETKDTLFTTFDVEVNLEHLITLTGSKLDPQSNLLIKGTGTAVGVRNDNSQYEEEVTFNLDVNGVVTNEMIYN